MLKQIMALVILVFTLGWFSHELYLQAAAMPAEEPVVHASKTVDYRAPVVTVQDKLPDASHAQEQLPRSGLERPSPADRLTTAHVNVNSNRVVIDGIKGRRFETAIFTDTNSMDPLIDEDTQAIQIIPLSPDEIKVGDVISYDAGKFGIIIHRVIEIGNDEQGWYARVKGDNNASPDPLKVRFPMIKRVLVGVLY